MCSPEVITRHRRHLLRAQRPGAGPRFPGAPGGWPGWTLSAKTQLSGFLLEAWNGRAGRNPRDIWHITQTQETEVQREEGTLPRALSRNEDPGPLPSFSTLIPEPGVQEPDPSCCPLFFLSSSFRPQLRIIPFLPMLLQSLHPVQGRPGEGHMREQLRWGGSIAGSGVGMGSAARGQERAKSDPPPRVRMAIN